MPISTTVRNIPPLCVSFLATDSLPNLLSEQKKGEQRTATDDVSHEKRDSHDAECYNCCNRCERHKRQPDSLQRLLQWCEREEEEIVQQID